MSEQQYRPECAEAPYWIEQAMRRLCKKWVDPTDSWPPCASCGKSARGGNHCTDLGFGHDYEPATIVRGDD